VIGNRLGHYEIREKIGAGGMGEVYRASDTKLGREVALKILPRDASRDPDRLRRFLTEARTVSALNHPNILTIHEIGESEDGPFLVTELIEGRTVRRMLADGPLPVASAVDIAVQAASGLANAHEAGIVHRDSKPDNLMVTGDGLVKILDFGLAKLTGPSEDTLDPNLTATGMIVGTPAYIPPERLQGAEPDGRSDLFSLGLVLYEMIVGANPFLRDSAAATLNAVLNERTPDLQDSVTGAPAAISAVIRKATAKRPADRYGDAREMAGALRAVESSGSVRALSGDGVGQGARLPKWAAVVPAAGILFALGVLFLPRHADEPGPASPAAPPPPPAASATVALPEGRLGVAVLPIQDRTGDPELASDEVGEVLANAFVQILSDFPNLYVISPTRLEGLAHSAGRSFAEAADDPGLADRIAVDAQARAVLSGTLSKIRDTYVLNARLTEVPSGVVLDSFQAQTDAPEQLLSELTRNVSTGMLARYGEDPTVATPESAKVVQDVATRSLDAYASYLRGNTLIEEGRWDDAIPELSRAVQIDPEMALAWSSLSCAYSFAGDDTNARAAHLKSTEFLDRVNERERRWIELDGIWVETGNGDLYLQKMEEYLRDFPDDRDSYFYAGLAEEWLEDDPAAALTWYEKAWGMVPIYYPVTSSLVGCYLKLDRRDDAVRALKRYLAQPHVGNYGRSQAERRLAELESGS